MKKRNPCANTIFRVPLLLLLLSLPAGLFAQESDELGLLVGATAYSGDLAPSPFAAQRINVAVGGFYRRMFDPKIGIKASINYARFRADRLDVPEFNNPRENIELKLGLVEITAQVEWHPLGGPRFNNVDVLEKNWTPFVAAGLGVAFGEAQLDTPPEFTDQFPEDDDKNLFLVVPLVGGIRFDVSRVSTLSIELGARAVFSDYLDGVSVYGDPDNSDWYWIGGISYVYYLGGASTYTSERKESRRRSRRRA